MFCNCFAVTGQHNAFLHTGILQRCNGFLRTILDHIRDQDVSGIFSVYRHMNHCTHTGIFRINQVQTLHQLCIAGCHLSAVYFGSYTMSADFLHITDVRGIQFFSISVLQTLADGMTGIALRISSILQQFFLREIPAGVNTRHIEYTLGQGTGLVKYHIFGLRQRFQIIGPLHQNTTGTCCSDSSEERKGNGNDQCTRAADYQESQGTNDPRAPGCRIAHDQVDHRRQDGQCQSTVADCRGIISCELRNKVLRLGLLHTGILYQIQNLGYGGFSKFLGGTDLK